jgi:rsbT co-antagonist protein RsbR
MTTRIQQFGEFLCDTTDEGMEQLVVQVARAGENFARVMEEGDLATPVRNTFLAIARSMAAEDESILIRYGQEIGLRRSRDTFSVRELINASDSVRAHIWQRLDVFLQSRDPWTVWDARHMEDFLHTFAEHYVSAVGESIAEARAQIAAQRDELEAQRQLIQELGTPVLPVREGILVLPLVGAVDSRRAMQIMETLLEAITQHQAGIVIIDITGVPMVDTSVADYLIQAARAARLVGAQIVLVGIGSVIAQTLVQLGVDLGTISTEANLQAGLDYAYQAMGYTDTGAVR